MRDCESSGCCDVQDKVVKVQGKGSNTQKTQLLEQNDRAIDQSKNTRQSERVTESIDKARSDEVLQQSARYAQLTVCVRNCVMHRTNFVWYCQAQRLLKVKQNKTCVIAMQM
jgi:hypothetical protein